jgi:uncharacterized membrane protein YkgB
MLNKVTYTQLEWIGRIALFVIFFWFGILKVFMLSPADELVEALRTLTIPFIGFNTFFIFLGMIECTIGLLFLYPKASHGVIIILLLHMGVTSLPLIVLPYLCWQSFLIPTLVGQYIIKNVALVALSLLVTLHTHKNLYCSTISSKN